MEVVLGHISVEEVVKVSHGHHRQMGGLRIGRSGEIGCVNGLMVVDVYRRDELWKVGLGFGEVIDRGLGVGDLVGLGDLGGRGGSDFG